MDICEGLILSTTGVDYTFFPQAWGPDISSTGLYFTVNTSNGTRWHSEKPKLIK